MALIECGDCKREISSLATSCPNCGAPVYGRGTTPLGAWTSSGKEAWGEVPNHSKVDKVAAAKEDALQARLTLILLIGGIAFLYFFREEWLQPLQKILMAFS
ncbi:hypothetical protein [Metapseudomonas resinovorans]|uniref:Zinc-ribbon domain-containing protein n=1 Tax=Metapseudomonas resinovorans NBRC 106553 TaxID=1245471 RepID=S6BF41_METRE|nr:hypothetical protein [Pseudomonas resinovorans]BAN47674.1 hypothetical protein PCA10_19420 [Pseudomonas resinovorans NBRC 106553]